MRATNLIFMYHIKVFQHNIAVRTMQFQNGHIFIPNQNNSVSLTLIFDKISSWIFLCYGRFVLLHRKWLESERKKVVFDDVLSYLSCCAFHTCRLPNATQTVPQNLNAFRSGSNSTKKAFQFTVDHLCSTSHVPYFIAF